MLNPKEFALWLEECEARHDGYIMCAIGQNPKALSEWYYSGQYSGKQLTKAYYWRENAQRVFDCQGMADGYVTEFAGLGTVNVRARNNYASWCGDKGEGTIPVDKRTEGAAVFIYSKSAGYITHVGFLVRPVDENNRAGDWWVVEARGVMYGVVKTRLEERQPNFWGWMTKYFDYETGAETGGFEALKNGDEGEAVKTLQTNLIRLGYDCGYWGADGDFGDATELAVRTFEILHDLPVDGVYGAEDAAKLEAALVKLDAAPEELPRWVLIMGGDCWVRSAPGTDGAKLGVARKGTKLSYGGQTSEDGWLLVAYDNQNGWVSGKYGKLES